jgi:hypothetical protein
VLLVVVVVLQFGRARWINRCSLRDHVALMDLARCLAGEKNVAEPTLSMASSMCRVEDAEPSTARYAGIACAARSGKQHARVGRCWVIAGAPIDCIGAFQAIVEGCRGQ